MGLAFAFLVVSAIVLRVGGRNCSVSDNDDDGDDDQEGDDGRSTLIFRLAIDDSSSFSRADNIIDNSHSLDPKCGYFIPPHHGKTGPWHDRLRQVPSFLSCHLSRSAPYIDDERMSCGVGAITLRHGFAVFGLFLGRTVLISCVNSDRSLYRHRFRRTNQ